MKKNVSSISGTDSAQAFERVESGIYRSTNNGCYYERPHINGKRTWRSLGTKNLKLAREELHKRRVKSISFEQILSHNQKTLLSVLKTREIKRKISTLYNDLLVMADGGDYQAAEVIVQLGEL